MSFLNRTAVVVNATPVFLKWLRSVDPTTDELTMEDLNREPTVYLLPECDSDEGAAKYVGRFCKQIFANELDGWWTDCSVWPKDLGYRVFSRWFKWRYHSVVMDLVKSALVREEF